MIKAGQEGGKGGRKKGREKRRKGKEKKQEENKCKKVSFTLPKGLGEGAKPSSHFETPAGWQPSGSQWEPHSRRQALLQRRHTSLILEGNVSALTDRIGWANTVGCDFSIFPGGT